MSSGQSRWTNGCHRYCVCLSHWFFSKNHWHIAMYYGKDNKGFISFPYVTSRYFPLHANVWCEICWRLSETWLVHIFQSSGENWNFIRELNIVDTLTQKHKSVLWVLITNIFRMWRESKQFRCRSQSFLLTDMKDHLTGSFERRSFVLKASNCKNDNSWHIELLSVCWHLTPTFNYTNSTIFWAPLLICGHVLKIVPLRLWNLRHWIDSDMLGMHALTLRWLVVTSGWTSFQFSV